ncbi:cation:proton antiporter [Paraburkholderia fungorum]|uniref:cation:proton antiporter domain-containing protein n=1 Tax=Paraburkholderia fungorum TaxID=134537 RepID=UPI0038BAD6DE
MQPDVVLVVLIPPLLMSSAFYTAWREFREELVPIMSLAVGAVGAVVCTTAMVALAARWASPSLPWGACIALGAIVSPSDEVAAKALLHLVSLAAALALAQAFPQRDLLVFTTFCVIFATVVLQGLTLGFLARVLKLPNDPENPNTPYLTVLEARALTFRASISELEAIDLKNCCGNEDLVMRLIGEYKVRADSNGYAVSGEVGYVRRHRSRLNLALRAVVAARRALVKLHEERQIKDAVLHKIEAELDLEEFRLRLLLGP